MTDSINAKPLLIYIHGFLSSSQSEKAIEIAEYLDLHALDIDYLAPTLSNYPLESVEQLIAIIDANSHRPIALVGSSMGGFTATVLSQRYQIPAILVNPAVRPYELIVHVLGDNTNPYTGEHFTLTQQHVDELKRLEVSSIDRPSLIKVFLQTGDETLDYRKAVDFYQGCEQLIEKGGDHRFQNFKKHLPEILKFLELAV